MAGAATATTAAITAGRAAAATAQRMIEQFDANQDGTVTQVEIDQVRKDRLAAFDQDNDGSLTLEEYQALWLDAMHARMVDRFQELDEDGDAIVTVEEFVGPFDSMVERIDRNGDGAISKDDMRRGPHHRGPADDADDRDKRTTRMTTASMPRRVDRDDAVGAAAACSRIQGRVTPLRMAGSLSSESARVGTAHRTLAYCRESCVFGVESCSEGLGVFRRGRWWRF